MYDQATGMEFKTASGNSDPSDRSIAMFSLIPELQAFASKEAGHPVYRDVEKVEILTPGNNKSTWGGYVTDEHRTKYAAAYRAFKDGQPAPVDGTPIEHWPPLSPAMAKNLMALNIRSVEQLASLSDAGVAEIGMGGRTLRDNAKNWLEDAKDGRPLMAALAQKEELEARLKVQDDTIRQLQEAIMRMQDARESPQTNWVQAPVDNAPSFSTGIQVPAGGANYPTDPEPTPIKRAYNRRPKE